MSFETKKEYEVISTKVGIFWDMENCEVPHDVQLGNAASCILNEIRKNREIDGEVITFCAYGDSKRFPKVTKGCRMNGITFKDVSNDKKNSADMDIIVDMLLFAHDNPSASIILISGDVDFAPALHGLNHRKYKITLVVPAGVNVSPDLCSPCKYVWDWPSLARGKGSVPPSKPVKYRKCYVPARKSVDGQYVEKSVQCNDIQDLKVKIVGILERSKGPLSFEQLQLEYHKQYGEELDLSKYGECELENLLKKMPDAMIVEKSVRLHNKERPTFPGNDKKGKGVLDDKINGCDDSDNFLNKQGPCEKSSWEKKETSKARNENFEGYER